MWRPAKVSCTAPSPAAPATWSSAPQSLQRVHGPALMPLPSSRAHLDSSERLTDTLQCVEARPPQHTQAPGTSSARPRSPTWVHGDAEQRSRAHCFMASAHNRAGPLRHFRSTHQTVQDDVSDCARVCKPTRLSSGPSLGGGRTAKSGW